MNTEKTSRTHLSELGEFGLIKKLTSQIELKNNSSLKGVGDDAAVIKTGEGRVMVVTSDMLNEGVHFDLMYTPLKHLGYKAAVVNFSDILAMNAFPEQITVSIGLSSKYTVEALEEIYDGLMLACDKYGVDLVGGDTCSIPHGMSISVTALGQANEDDIVYRNGARENDLLVVTGDLGSAYLGLQILEREKAVFQKNPDVQPDLSGYDYILERQLKPEARKDMLELFKKLDVKPTAMIDISDGLASDVLHICDSSSLGCEIFDEKLPIDPTAISTAQDFNLDPTTCAMNGGEDYELLFTISQEDFDKIKGNPHLTPVGYITEQANGCSLVAKDGSRHAIRAQGWDAFMKDQLSEDE